MFSKEMFSCEYLFTVMLSFDLWFIVPNLLSIIPLIPLHVLVSEVLLNALFLCLCEYFNVILLLIGLHKPRVLLDLGNGETLGGLGFKQCADQAFG